MPSFESYTHQDLLRIVLADGTVMQGNYQHIAGMNFLHVRDGSPMGRVEGPLDLQLVDEIRLLATKDEINAEKKARLRGDPFPGRAPRTRDDYEYRLGLLARAIAAEANKKRRDELIYQFNDLGDEIRLAQSKRAWLLAEGRFSLISNAPPTMRDLWIADVASPSLFKRPRPQDFDPAPAERRKRVPLPEDVLAEKRSIPNMLAALRAAGFKARISLAGDPPHERADIQVDLSENRHHRFILEGRRLDAVTNWRMLWAGNHTATGLRRYRSITRTDTYRQFIAVAQIAREAV
ncbi:hypothetical protein [Paracoccus sp. TOH]|uniref:hypothetical protein n=1 Tax=Paracoccus sp. TOH TaxID=1263728 RepID=UPI0025B1E8B8|nr:hypothetical protein [Paracoccus sp. TOH]WJS87295.1 hypothetical protein NBE95_20665 [Paracoccus sp. TOH]